MNDALNEQIGYEFAASLQYVAIASHFAGEGLSCLANHFYKQANEERDHAMRFVNYIVDAGGDVAIPDIKSPQAKFSSVEEAITLSYNQEKEVTTKINSLVELAMKESDHITFQILSWFVTEQLEEVSGMDNLLKVVRLAGKNLLYIEEYIARHSGTAKGIPGAPGPVES
ncbi:MAG: ferritin [Limisphaerales bacterium]